MFIRTVHDIGIVLGSGDRSSVLGCSTILGCFTKLGCSTILILFYTTEPIENIDPPFSAVRTTGNAREFRLVVTLESFIFFVHVSSVFGGYSRPPGCRARDRQPLRPLPRPHEGRPACSAPLRCVGYGVSLSAGSIRIRSSLVVSPCCRISHRERTGDRSPKENSSRCGNGTHTIFIEPISNQSVSHSFGL